MILPFGSCPVRSPLALPLLAFARLKHRSPFAPNMALRLVLSRDAVQVASLAVQLVCRGRARLDAADATLVVNGITGYIGLRFSRLLGQPDSEGWYQVWPGLYHLTLANTRGAPFDLDYAAHCSLVVELQRIMEEEQLVFTGEIIFFFDQVSGEFWRCILPLDDLAFSSERLFRAVHNAVPASQRHLLRPLNAGGLHVSLDGLNDRGA